MKRSHQPFPWIIFSLLLLLDVVVWMVEKIGVTSIASSETAFIWGVAKQPLIWVAIGMGPLQLWLWTRILGKTDLSLAYPLTSLAYPLTMICAQIVFHEHIGWMVWMGAILITSGVALIGNNHKPPAVDG